MTSIGRNVLARELPYKIRMQRRAKRDLQRLSDEDYERVNTRVHFLAQNPRPDRVVKLKTDKASYRIRVGPWRGICLVDDVVIACVYGPWTLAHVLQRTEIEPDPEDVKDDGWPCFRNGHGTSIDNG